jgi:hypothetical protein
MAIVGADCYQNSLALRNFTNQIKSAYRPKCYVTHQSFADVLKDQEIEVTCVGLCQDPCGYDVAMRIGRMLDVDVMYELPVDSPTTRALTHFAGVVGIQVLQVPAASDYSIGVI